jgi:hypothetical protein
LASRPRPPRGSMTTVFSSSSARAASRMPIRSAATWHTGDARSRRQSSGLCCATGLAAPSRYGPSADGGAGRGPCRVASGAAGYPGRRLQQVCRQAADHDRTCAPPCQDAWLAAAECHRSALHDRAAQSAWGTDRGKPIVTGVIAALRAEKIILPAPEVIERTAIAGRARARKRAADALLAGLSPAQLTKLGTGGLMDVFCGRKCASR